ncbi:MAG: class I adenylate-forming enzyme family protein [Rhodospirillaceae bacterium]
MPPKVGGTTPGAEHDFAIPFESVRTILKKYRDRDPQKNALFDLTQRKSITFGELHDWTNRIANWLVQKGIQKGDRVALLSEERLEKLILWMGIWRAGAVCCPTNVEMNVNYVSEILTHLDCKLAFFDAELDIDKMLEGVVLDKFAFKNWTNHRQAVDPENIFCEIYDIEAFPECDRDYSSSDDATIFCTSGTTDKPKNFLIDHLAHWSFGLSTIDQLGLTEDDKTLEFRSFGWNSAQGLSLMPWLETGCTLHFARRFSHSNFFDWIKEHNITFSAGIPTVINMLLDRPTGVTAADVPSLRLMSSSTAPLAPERWKQFEETYGINLLQFFGCSEGGWVCGNRHYAKKYGTVGPPAKHQEFLLIDADGLPVAQGEEGEVTLGGPQCAKASMTADGVWEDLTGKRVPLGDLAVMDEEGFITVTGRLKDLIIRGGVNISPVEVDNIMMAHPKVYEAAGVGVPDDIYGEEIVAYLVVREGEILSEEEIKAHCAQNIPEYRMPKEFHFIDALPKNDRGKVRRPDLREIWISNKNS